MRLLRPHSFGGGGKFFRLALSHNTLQNMYLVNFAMLHHHKYSLAEFENMFPWERDIYVGLLSDYIEQENQKIQEHNAKAAKG
jgi:hypothetical protein